MAHDARSELAIKPYRIGLRNGERAIVRLARAPRYLCLDTRELEAMAEIAATRPGIHEFLARHLTGESELGFKRAVSLLEKLHRERFLSGASPEMRAMIHDVRLKAQSDSERRLTRLVAELGKIVDWPLMSFGEVTVDRRITAAGRLAIHPVGLIVMTAALIALALTTPLDFAGQGLSVTLAELARSPLGFLARAFVLLSLAKTLLVVAQLAFLTGAGARLIGGSLRLTGLAMLRLAIDDEDAFMLPRRAFFRYRAATLILPWLLALASWQLAGSVAGSTLGLSAGIFAVLGAASLCPLYRSSLVKLVEGHLVRTGLVRQANDYLTRGMLRALIKSRDGETNARRPALGQDVQAWLAILASVSLAWLYLASLALSDALLGVIPDLVVTVLSTSWATASFEELGRAVGAAAILGVMAVATLLVIGRLGLILVQNLAAVAEMPLKRSREGIGRFAGKALSPSAAVLEFLRAIPIFSELGDDKLEALVKALRFKRYPKGATIIQQGEDGLSFFILAEGQAQVIIERERGIDEVIDVLEPGDSFGEIALIENVRRTATIRARTAVLTLVLGKAQFDALFPEASRERSDLTKTIRQVKLLLESQAFSHLAPSQIRTLLRRATLVKFVEGQTILRENDEGDAAYLIQDGWARVTRDGSEETVAHLSRGELIGAIALIRGIRRTATVTAESELTCLKIDKETFLAMCMSNVFVAMLVHDLSERQLTELKAS